MPKKTNGQRLDDLEVEVQGQGKCLSRMEGELHNGIHAKVQQIEKLTWWVLRIMVALISLFVGAMTYLIREGSLTMRENQKLLLDHIKTSGYVTPDEDKK